jgi:DNA-directed RNA polymerase subunit E'/Rpb7
MDNFIEIKHRDMVKISPCLLNSNYSSNIHKILKKKYEGICSKFGFIKNDSIQLISIKKGVIELSTFHGYVLFEVEFMASVCNPSIGSIVKCSVKNINSFGIMCVSGTIENNVFHNILNVIIPKNNSQFVENANYLDNISINDEVNVEILGKKYILNNKNINIFGKIIESASDKQLRLDALEEGNNLDYEDEDDVEVVISDDDENNDDEIVEKQSVMSDFEINEEEVLDDEDVESEGGVESDQDNDDY